MTWPSSRRIVWRWKPTVTVTAGLRYRAAVADACRPTASSPRSDLDGVCGPSGSGQRPRRPVLQHVQSRAACRTRPSTPEFVRYSRTPRAITRTTTTSRRTSVSRGGRTSQSGFLRSSSATRSWRRSTPASRAATTVSGSTASPTVFDGNPGGTLNATRATQATGSFPLVPAGDPLADSAPREEPPRSAGIQSVRTFPSRRLRRTTRAHLRSGYRGAVHRLVETWPPALARPSNTVCRVALSWATEPLPWTNENWNAINIYENVLLNGEFQVGPGQPARQRATPVRPRTVPLHRHRGHEPAADHAGALQRSAGNERQQPVRVHREHGCLPPGRQRHRRRERLAVHGCRPGREP